MLHVGLGVLAQDRQARQVGRAVLGMDDAGDQLGIGEKFLRRVAGDGLTGRGNILEAPLRSQPIDPVLRILGEQAILGLRLLQGELGLAAGAPIAHPIQGTPNGRRQSRQVVLDHEIGEPQPQQLHCRFRADTAAEQDHGQIGMTRPHTLQGLAKRHGGHVVVRHQQISGAVDGVVELPFAADPSAFQCQPLLAQVALQQQEVGG